MVFNSIKSRLLLSHITVASIAAVAASVYLFVSFINLQKKNAEHSLLSGAYALADTIETDFGTPHGLLLIRHAMSELAKEEGAQFAVMHDNGQVISATVPDIHPGETLPVAFMHPGDVKVYQSAASNPRYGRITVDVPVERNRLVVGVVRAWISAKDYQATLAPIKRVTGLALVGVIVICIMLTLVIASALLSPINKMKRLSRRIANGDFTIRIKHTSSDELGQLAADLNTMAARLLELENSRRDFLGDVSHELRSPVSNIRITNEVLMRRASKLGDNSVALFQTVITETERLEVLINELMELAAIKSGSFTLNKEQFSIKQLLMELAESSAPKAQQKRQTTSINVPTELDLIADRDRIGRAVTNLLDNAIKFTPTEGHISLSCRSEHGQVTIQVTDTGEGIDPAELPKVFERFYRADKARNRAGGSGIGLAIVQAIAEAHGGTVGVSSNPGSGSTFWISLPDHGMNTN